MLTFFAAFLTTDLAEVCFAFTFAETVFLVAVFFVALVAAFFSWPAFFLGAATGFAMLATVSFLEAVELDLADFFEDEPPKIPSHPSEYFSFVPTRVIVTESPSNKN